MDTQSQLLAEIEAFVRHRKIAETTFGRRAVNDGKFVARLRAGANMTLATIDKATAFIRDHEADEVATPIKIGGASPSSSEPRAA